MGNKRDKQKLQMAILGIILASLYFGLGGTGEATEQNPFSELNEIIAVMDNEEIKLTEWTLFTRDHLNNWTEPGEYENELKAIQHKTDQFHWDELSEHHNGQKKAIALLIHHETGVTETLTYIVYPHNEQLHSYLLYEIKGTEKLAENHRQTLATTIKHRYQDLFKNNTKFFTCATGIGSDKLNFGLYDQAQKIINQFSAKKIELLKEETFISISAYTNTWNNMITTNAQNMNLQVAIRASQGLGGETTVTIGTPIITTEY